MTRRVTSATFIGRAAELESLRLLLQAVRGEGRGTTLLLAGEAGVGKTRFLSEMAARAAEDGWTVLRGQCDEFSGQRPFAALQGMGPAIRDFLAAELPGELETHGWQAVSSTWQMDTSTNPALAAGSIAYHVSQLLQSLAHVRPLLVVMDDLHWADESTRLLFATLARGLEAVPAVLAGAYRGDEVHRQHPLFPILGAVERSSRPERISLEAFTFDEATQLAAAITATPGSCMPLLYERSGGNAFLLEELLATPDGELPAGVAEVVLSRLSTLGQDAVDLAEAAALDSTLPLPVLLSASGLARERFDVACDLLVERGFSRIEPAGMSFRHALIREVVYDRIPPSRRMTVHRRTAQAFEEFDARRAGEAARHWQLAGDIPKALRASVAAGMAAARVGAMPEAADLFEYALHAWPDVSDPETTAGITHARLAEEAGDALTHSRRFARAAEVLEAALKEPAMPAIQRSALLLRLSLAYACLIPMDRALEPAREAVECLASERSLTRRLFSMIAFVQYACQMFDRSGEAKQMLERAEEISKGTDSLLIGVCMSFMRAAVATAYGEETARAHLEENARLAAEVPNSTFHNACFRVLLGEHDWILSEGIKERDWLSEIGWGLVEGPLADALIAISLSRLGRWSDCIGNYEPLVRRYGEETIFGELSDVIIHGWGLTFVRTGGEGEVRAWMHFALQWAIPVMTQYSMAVTAVRVELARLDDDIGESREAVNHLLSRINGHFLAISGEPVALAIAFEADHAFRQRTDTAESLAMVDRWIAKLESCLVDAPGRVNLADFGVFLEQCRLERARLAGADDPGGWEQLADTWAALPRPFDAAYARFRAAWALLMGPAPASHKDRQRATAHLLAARATSQELGAIYLERDIESLWQSAGLREERPAAVTVKNGTKAAVGPNLTPRESEVLALMARGDSNGRIAIALGISARTAAVHVSNVIHKFGARTRVEAAMRARDLGLL